MSWLWCGSKCIGGFAGSYFVVRGYGELNYRDDCSSCGYGGSMVPVVAEDLLRLYK